MRRLLAIALIAAPVAAQPTRMIADPARVATNVAVRHALDSLRATNGWTLAQQTAICEIPAPPFKEAARAAELKRRFDAQGLKNVRIDAEGNVFGERPGSATAPTVLLSAHLDTVFPDG